MSSLLQITICGPERFRLSHLRGKQYWAGITCPKPQGRFFIQMGQENTDLAGKTDVEKYAILTRFPIAKIARAK